MSTLYHVADSSNVSIELTELEEVKSHPLETEKPHQSQFLPVDRVSHRVASAIVGVSVLSLSIFNHLIKNTSLGAKAQIADDRAFLGNLCITNWITHIYKGIWRDVASYPEQAKVLASLPIFAFVCDLGMYLADPTSGQIVGPTTVLASLVSFALLAKTVAKVTLGQVPFTQTDRESSLPEWLTKQKIFVYGLVAGVASLAATCDHVMSAATKPIIFSGFSGILSKIGKSLIKVTATEEGEETAKKKRIFAVLGLGAIVPVVSCLMGLAFPWDLENNPGFDRASSIAYHYLGAPTAIAISALGTNLLIRAWQKPKAHAKNYYKTISTKKRVINSLGYLGVTVASAAAHTLNNGSNSAISLATKLCQMGWGFHMVRELLKGTDKKIGAAFSLLS